MAWGHRADFIGMLRRVFKLSSISGDLESRRAISQDPSQLMLKESVDFNDLKIATLIRCILFI